MENHQIMLRQIDENLTQKSGKDNIRLLYEKLKNECATKSEHVEFETKMSEVGRQQQNKWRQME